MISLAGLTMHYGSKMLFEDSSLSFNSGKRYGLVGANGVGKTTLLRLITGEETPSRGVISIPRDVQLGVLRQDHFRFEQDRILDVVLQGKPALWTALQEKANQILNETESPTLTELPPLEYKQTQRCDHQLRLRRY